MSLLPSGAIETTGYDINNSLRFRSSASSYLQRTPVSAGNRKTFTISFWFKRGSLGTDIKFLSAYSADSDNGNMDFRLTSGNILYWGPWSTGITTTAVFRDPSAWYHVVLAIDTTQATGANRHRVYVNGVEYTFSGTAVTQNTDLAWNNTISHNIGRNARTSDGYFDGYMTEFHSIDGQALTPSSFGETDAITGVWKAKKYTGSYGTNGFYLPFTNANTSSHAGSFNGSSQGLTFTPTSNIVFGSNDYTVEAWVNFNSIGAGTQVIYQSGSSGTNNFYLSCQSGFVGVGTQAVYVSQQTTTLTANKWYHIVACRASGTLRLFVNGTQIGSSVTDSTSWLASGTASLGYAQYVSGQYLNGSISNVRVVNGTGLYTSNFVPPSSPLTAVTNTQLLTLQNSSIVDTSANAYTITNVGSVTTSASYPFAANISSDRSGNANNWITNNIQVATPSATTYDAMTDSPTLTSATVGNYCTINPLLDLQTYATYSEGNLKVSTTASAGYAMRMQSKGTMSIPPSGKWYFAANASDCGIIIGNDDPNRTQYGASVLTTNVRYQSGGDVLLNNNTFATVASFTSTDEVGFAIDMDALTVGIYKNGSLLTTVTGVTSGFTYYPMTIVNSSSTAYTAYWNFGQRPFSYTPPSGYKTLNTYNLPTPTILQGNKYMDATTYTGTGASLSVTNAAGFKPDFVWGKDRAQAQSHLLFDSVRGVHNFLSSNSTSAESTNSTTLTAFNSNGFQLGTNATLNQSGISFVGWQWQAGQGSTSSNTQGSITSTVSVNTTPGFSVATYTGTGSNATVGHGLGVAPSMVVVKSRTTAENWMVYHISVGATKYIYLDGTGAAVTLSTIWNNTAPTSSVFSIGTNVTVNQSSTNYVAYCWAEIAGFSKFGSYTGNGSTDGPFIFTGFRPAFIMFKRTNDVSDWNILDTTRSPYNTSITRLFANVSNAENSSAGNYDIDILSNGFKQRNTNASTASNSNLNGSTYIYMAFAENPFKNSLAR